MPKILVIDDDQMCRSMLRLVLEQAGHQVVEATEGAQGMRLYRIEPVPLVFCDLFMEGQEGLETIQLLRREDANVKIVAMSGGGFQGAIDCLPLALKVGANKALNKPFGMAAVREILKEMLPES